MKKIQWALSLIITLAFAPLPALAEANADEVNSFYDALYSGNKDEAIRQIHARNPEITDGLLMLLQDLSIKQESIQQFREVAMDRYYDELYKDGSWNIQLAYAFDNPTWENLSRLINNNASYSTIKLILALKFPNLWVPFVLGEHQILVPVETLMDAVQAVYALNPSKGLYTNEHFLSEEQLEVLNEISNFIVEPVADRYERSIRCGKHWHGGLKKCNVAEHTRISLMNGLMGHIATQQLSSMQDEKRIKAILQPWVELSELPGVCFCSLYAYVANHLPVEQEL